jgi:hypothetical protein
MFMERTRGPHVTTGAGLLYSEEEALSAGAELSFAETGGHQFPWPGCCAVLIQLQIEKGNTMKQPTVFHYQVSLYCAGFLLGAVSGAFGWANPPVDPLDFHLVPLGLYANGAPFDTAAAKVVAHDPLTQRLYVANARDNRVEVLDIMAPTQPTKIGQKDMNDYGAIVNGVAVHNGLVAVVMQNAVKTSPGNAVFFDSELNVLNVVPVGALPDFVVFSPDGRWVVVANEGEPNTYNNADKAIYGPSIDPEGSVTIIDLATGLATPMVNTATFTAFNDVTLDPSIRIFGPNATVAQDLEPESIAISADSRTAYVTLQVRTAGTGMSGRLVPAFHQTRNPWRDK